MKILLTSNASYIPPRGGATRSNIIWLEALAAKGHTTRVVASALTIDPQGKLEQIEHEEIHHVPLPAAAREGIEVAQRGPILVHSVADPARRAKLLCEQIQEFNPDWVLVSSEDLGQLLLREALSAAPGRVVYLAHTPQLFPFGPASWNPDPKGTELVRQCAAVIAIGEHTANYIRQHSGAEATVIHPPMYGSGPFEKLGSFDHGLITMINPCAVKGISIFLALAKHCPEYSFGALPGWGTTEADRAELERLPNVTLLAHAKHIGTVLANTRLFLMPSLWYEGFGLSVMEAMLHGLPVLASDSGGLLEAKLGTRFIVPVRPIERYKPVFDEHGLPEPEVPPQDIGIWVDALRTILSDRALYEEESETSRARALRFVNSVKPERLEEFLLSLPRSKGAPPGAMRILLAQNSPYYPAHGGGDKSNRLLIEALTARGHQCRVVARIGSHGGEAHQTYIQELKDRGIVPSQPETGLVVFNLNGVEVHVVTDPAKLRNYFAAQIASLNPGVILTSTDDPAHLLLDAALRVASAKIVYLARATLALPFGPDCAFPSPEKTEALRRVDAVVGVSQYVADYIRKWSEIEAVHVPISLMEPGPYPSLGRFENEFVTLVNPCAVKGISIFLALAERMSDVRFAAVPTWGTSEEDHAALRKHSNVEILDPVDDIDRLLARTRVLLVPSLWAEARSRIVVEAMLRGVPVIASNVGGIPEAKMGFDYLLPVRPIEKYQPRLDEKMVPIAEVPEQDIGPWEGALRKLITNRDHYEALSKASRTAALSYVEKLSVGPLENILRTADRRAGATPAPALQKLSPEKRKLLALRLKQKTAAKSDSWFPALELKPGAKLRLFCFPYAGGGASAFHSWGESLPAEVVPCPVRLPGRESRLAEPPLESMDQLVDALSEAIQPHLETPFAFFGHSMGAAIAFELTRSLRKRGQPLPARLFVSGARAPQFRRNHVPPREPNQSEFLDELRRLEGIPNEVLQNEDLLRVVLPALRADTMLYRNYIYFDEPPLNLPIRAYGGLHDPNLRREHLEPWREQTTSSFSLQMFDGGHFFIQTAKADFLDALGRDLADIVQNRMEGSQAPTGSL